MANLIDVDGANVNPGPFGAPLEFGEAYCELSATGWIHAVSWSPSGNTLAYASHSSTVYFATFVKQGEPIVRTVRLHGLPMTSLVFVTEGACIGGGHDYNPTIFLHNNGSWAVNGVLDDEKKSKAVNTSSSVSKARELFTNKTRNAQDSKADADTLKTTHERPLFNMEVAEKANNKVTKISSVAMDGELVVWDIPAEISIDSLSL